MARSDFNGRVTPSVLDRLIDLEPRESREAARSWSTSLSELKAAVRRDLEWLLNTRCFLDPRDVQLEEAPRSVAFYGLPDITSFGMANPDDQKRLTKRVEEGIRFFEPRFLDVKVTVEPPTETERTLRFRIEARLDVDPAPEPVVFDSVLDIASGDFAVIEN